MNDFTNALFNNTTCGTVTAYFTDGTKADYTKNILDLLKTEPDIHTITDGETGELIYTR